MLSDLVEAVAIIFTVISYLYSLVQAAIAVDSKDSANAIVDDAIKKAGSTPKKRKFWTGKKKRLFALLNLPVGGLVIWYCQNDVTIPKSLLKLLPFLE